MSKPSSPTRLALVGCGWISEAHVNGYKALHAAGCRDFTVTAVVDVNPAAARTRAGQIAAFQGSAPQVFADLETCARAAVADAVDICLPHAFHHRAAISACELGLHVLLEKPLGITIRASRAIIAAAERHGRVLATAENTRRSPGSRAAVWAVREANMIGEAVAATVTINHVNHADLSDPKWAWRHVRLINGGGTLIDGGAHFADMAMQLFGEVAEVACTTRTLAPATMVEVPKVGRIPTDAEDWWHAVIRFTSDMHLTWSYCSRLPGADLSSGIYRGREGAIVDRGGWLLHPFEGGASVQRPGVAALDPDALQQQYQASLTPAQRARLFPFGVTDSFAIEVWDFIDAIRSARKPEMDGLDGLRAKALCLACYESAALDGKPVSYRDVLEGRIDAYQRPIDRHWGLLPGEAKSAAG
jgi:predicted dehydrogenase